MKGLKERLREARLDRDALHKRTLPLRAFYAREADVEERRNQFYAAMAKAYGWPARYLAPMDPAVEHVVSGGIGRDGRPAKLRAIGQKHVMPVILNAAPLEYLFSNGMLQGDTDQHGAAYRRFSAGQRLRGIFEGAEISGLKTANLEGASGGGIPGRLPGEYKMDCIRSLAELRGGPDDQKAIRPGLFMLLEAVVYRDRWIWEEVRGNRQAAVIVRLHKALDLLSVRFRMMTARDFNDRWYKATPPGEDRGSPAISRHQLPEA